jgi:tRNA A-37 threonylcarbamoyl transferase component Bud32
MQASLNPAAVPQTDTSSTQTRLNGTWLSLARVVWAVVTAVTLILLVVAIPAHYRYSLNDSEFGAASMTSFGLPPTSGSIYNVLLDVLTVALFLGVAILLFARRSDEKIALLSSLMLVTWGGTGTTWLLKSLMAEQPAIEPIVGLLKALGDVLLVAFVYTMPDGVANPRWTRWIVLGYAVWTLLYTLLPSLPLINPNSWPDLPKSLVPFLVYAGSFPVQVYRYKRLFTPAQVQQGKWVLYGFTFALVGFASTFVPETLFPALKESRTSFTILEFFVQTFLLFAVGAVPVAIAFSVQRYRLWDIDFFINRSLVYAAVTTVLALIFFVSVLFLEWAVQALTGATHSPIAYAASAVGVGITFQPLSRWLQRLVDRRLFNLRLDVRQLSAQQKTPAVQSGPAISGSMLGSYAVGELIARGGMGEIYKGEHTTLNRPVAIKLLPEHMADNADFRARFEREARMVAGLRHPNIVNVFDFGYTDTSYYMVMEYIDGQELRDYIRAAAPLPLDEVRALIRDIASALDYAHEQGLVHRDVKPSNVMLQPSTISGGKQTGKRAILMDFGIAKMTNGTTGRTTGVGVVGTLDYMAPEQIQAVAEIDGRADIYSLGVVLYEMVTGKLPFQADNVGQLLFAHLQQPAPDPRDLRPDLPVDFADAILRALAKSPDARWQTAAALAAALA